MVAAEEEVRQLLKEDVHKPRRAGGHFLFLNIMWFEMI